MDKKKLIWISPHLPYSTVNHAAGKTQYFYLSSLNDTDAYDIRLIAFYWQNELNKFDISNKIQCDLVCYVDHGLEKLKRNFIDINSLKNPFHKYGNVTTKFLQLNILRILKGYKNEGYIPDAIVLHWTQTVLFAKEVKQIFPSAKIIAIEEDVTLLSYERRVLLKTSIPGKFFANKRYKNVKREEIAALSICDMIIVNNHKDKKILQGYGFKENLRVWSVYFDNMRELERKNPSNKDVVFYGAMSRPENYMSAEWLIKYVRPLVKNMGIRFIILGGNPPESLKTLSNEDVIVTGFVEDIKPYFANSLCLVAPLILGAGIKVKILEAMSSGLPVLTNEIGIEGIPAEDKKHYYFCSNPEEYANIIRQLIEDSKLGASIGNAAKNLLNSNFDYNADSKKMINWIDSLLG